MMTPARTAPVNLAALWVEPVSASNGALLLLCQAASAESARGWLLVDQHAYRELRNQLPEQARYAPDDFGAALDSLAERAGYARHGLCLVVVVYASASFFGHAYIEVDGLRRTLRCKATPIPLNALRTRALERHDTAIMRRIFGAYVAAIDAARVWRLRLLGWRPVRRQTIRDRRPAR